MEPSALANAQRLYGNYSAQPFNEATATQFLKDVSQNQAALAASPEGKLLIAKAARARMVLALKRNLDKCFGGDILQLEAARLTMTAAMNSDFEPDCTFSNSAFENLDGLTNDLESWILSDNSGNQSERRSQLVKAIFTDTALRAADAESRLRYLFKDPTNTPELLTAMCGTDSKGCPKEFVATFRQRSQAMKQKLQQAGYRPLAASEISSRLNSEMRAMFDAVYDPKKPYHTAQFDKDRWSALAPGKNDPPEYTRPLGEARLTFQPYPNALTHPGLTPKGYQDLADQLQERYRAAIPETFYQRQSRLRSDEYGLALATSRDWMHALGHGATVKPVPFVMGSPGVVMGLIATDRSGTDTPLAVDQAMSLITAESVRQNRDTSLQRLNDTLGEMGVRVFSSKATDSNQQEDLQKLLIANPRAAGEILLRNPKNADLYCEAFLAIQREEKIDKYMNWGLLGLTIGAAIVTGGASLLGAGAVAAVGSATLATVGAVDILYGVSDGFEQTELGNLQHATCVSEGPDSKACQEYQDTMNSAMESFALAGIGVTGTGPFLKTLGRLSRGSEKVLSESLDELSAAARFLREEEGRKLVDTLSESAQGELLGYLSQIDDSTRSRIAAHIQSLNEEQTAGFARKLLEHLRGGKSIDELLPTRKASSVVKDSETEIEEPDMDPEIILPIPPYNLSKAKAPKWTGSLHYDPDSIVRDAEGRVKIPSDYRDKVRQFARMAEDRGYDTIVRQPTKTHPYEMVCFQRGPSSSVLGRVSSSQGAKNTLICLDPFLTKEGNSYRFQKLVTLNWNSLVDSIEGRGYILLHEMGHESDVRRAVNEGTGKFPNESFVPYGYMTPVKDPNLIDSASLGPAIDYLETGFSFGELHSQNRQLNQMVADALRGELSVPPTTVDSFFTSQKQNTFALDKFSHEALAAFRDLPKGKNVSRSGFEFKVSVEEVVVDKKKHELQMLIISKPLKSKTGDVTHQSISIMIPPGPEDYSIRVEKQLARLAKRTKEIWNDTLKKEAEWEKLRPKP